MHNTWIFLSVFLGIVLSFSAGDAGEKKPGDRDREYAERYKRDEAHLVKRWGKSKGKMKEALDAHAANRQALIKICEEIGAAKDAGDTEKANAGNAQKILLDAKGRRTWETFRARESESQYLDDGRYMNNWKRGLDEYSQKSFDLFLAAREKARESWSKLAVAIHEEKPWLEVEKLRIMAETDSDRARLHNTQFDIMKESGRMLREAKKAGDEGLQKLTPAMDTVDKKTEEAFSKRHAEAALREQGRLLETELRAGQQAFWKVWDVEKKRFDAAEAEKKKIAAAEKAADDKKRKEEAAKLKEEKAKQKKIDDARKKREAKLDKMPLDVETEAK